MKSQPSKKVEGCLLQSYTTQYNQNHSGPKLHFLESFKIIVNLFESSTASETKVMEWL